MCNLQKVHEQAGPLAVADQENAKNDQDSSATGKYFTTRKRNKVKLYVPTGRGSWNLKEEGGKTQQNHCFIVKQMSDVLDILIIGAGWAGATATKTLINGGRTSNIKVPEVRDYTGGRTHTIMESVWEGQEDYPLDIGSQWIHGIKGNPIPQVASANGISYHLTEYLQMIYNEGGAISSDEVSSL